jgi:hypothetical protein
MYIFCPSGLLLLTESYLTVVEPGKNGGAIICEGGRDTLVPTKTSAIKN